MLVQGGGGNVSWKDGKTLWIKASGRWLAEADADNIFVPVDLSHLLQATHDGIFDAIPIALGATGLKPSIETVLHAVMPHRFVVHLHPVAALAFLVRRAPGADLESRLKGLDWQLVEYRKPGGLWRWRFQTP